MELTEAVQQLELLQKKLYAYTCADSSLYLDAVTVAHPCRGAAEADDLPRDKGPTGGAGRPSG